MISSYLSPKGYLFFSSSSILFFSVCLKITLDKKVKDCYVPLNLEGHNPFLNYRGVEQPGSSSGS
ncbi:MAG: hypothetical protein BGO67_02565 [Alphaproteobacteria bacterium 41-28]|nr:MAG: hypothetical protein BGO67_02565 [Alphaproteobacteria bacterium 41-28]